MKNSIILSFVALVSVYCFSFVNRSAVKPDDTPTLILLQDSDLSTTLQATPNGDGWEISGGNAGAYLSSVGNAVFGQATPGGFQDIKIEFNADFTKGTLTGIGTDQNGARVPIGVQYEVLSQSGATLTMGDTEKHSCAGVNCPCCSFLKREDGTIKGCKCETEDHDCRFPSGVGSCNHSVSQ